MIWNWSNTARIGAGTAKAPLLRACRMDQRFSYYVYLPKGLQKEGVRPSRILAAIHGTFRDAESLKNHFRTFADETNTVILAPLFPTGILDREDLHNYKFIRYREIRFDEILLDMIAEIREAFSVTEEKVMIYGFSGGGQFVHRFLYLHPEILSAAVIGSPGRITYLDTEEDYFAGIRNIRQVFGREIDFEELKKVKIFLFVGGEDRENISYEEESSHPALNKFGNNRLERLTGLYRNYRDYGLNVDFEIVPGVAHEEEKVVSIGADFLKKVVNKEK